LSNSCPLKLNYLLDPSDTKHTPLSRIRLLGIIMNLMMLINKPQLIFQEEPKNMPSMDGSNLKEQMTIGFA